MDIFNLTAAIICMSFALMFYSIGIWAEHIEKMLKKWHIIFFVSGLIADSLGTYIMTELPGLDSHAGMLHLATGTIALLLMAFHAAWACVTYFWGSEHAKQNFHKFSILVWCFWLVPCVISGFL